jgi:hypothetical protein
VVRAETLQALADKNRTKQGHVGCGLFPQPTAHTCCAQCVLDKAEAVNTLQRQARLFRLVRHTNPTVILAEGVEWSDGAATLRWRGPHPGTSTWDAGIDALLTAHDTGGRTQLHWAEDPQAVSLAGPPSRDAAPDPTIRADRTRSAPIIWLPAPAPDGMCSRCGGPWPCLACGP